jgi:putative proteasome-type protease
VREILQVDESNPYFSMIRGSWGSRLREAFKSMDDPIREPAGARFPLKVPSDRYEVLRRIGSPPKPHVQ